MSTRTVSVSALGASLVGVVLALAGSVTAWADPAPSIAYVSMGSNEGVATGGHSGIRLGGLVFHFERQTGGLLRMRREDFESVRHRYSALENRTMVVRSVSVTPETYRLIHEEFTLRYAVQEQHVRVHDLLRADRHLLEATLAARTGSRPPGPVVLEGVGLFLEEVELPGDGAARASVGAMSPALDAFRRRVADALGDGFLAGERARIARDLDALRPDADETLLTLAVDRPPVSSYPLSQRYRDTVTMLAALAVVEDARPLRDGSLVGTREMGPRLDAGDLELIDRLALAQEASLLRLLRSSRPDRGFPLLVGMARLAALDESRRSGRWQFVDSLPADVTVIRGARLARYPDLARGLLAEARGDFAAARAALAAADTGGRFPEADWSTLEAAGGHFTRVLGAVFERRDLPFAGAAPLPSRGAVLRQPRLAALGVDELRASLTAARRREERQAEALERLYGYEVFTRNCVTEIFETIDAAFARAVIAAAIRDGVSLSRAQMEERVQSESDRRLGGHVEGAPNFLPAAAAIAVERAWRVDDRVEIPSHRRSMLARMYEQQNVLRVFLRESNTLTSTLYRWTHDDSTFLFFTDDALVPRPLFGALNLVTGLIAAAAGLVRIPIDGGDLTVSGLKGAFFSLPELAFLNIRKGSFEHVERLRPAALAGRRPAAQP
jgi:hypothetical protein